MNRAFTLVLGLLALCGCSGDETSDGGAALIDNDAWILDEDADHDPFRAHKTTTEMCNPNTVISEDGVLELETRLCDYFVVSQPSLVAISAGDQVVLEWSHLDLDAPEAAEGHLALTIDGDLQWETTVAIPNEPNVYTADWTASRDLASGSRITLHLHNHGINSWRLHSLTRQAP